MDLARILRSHPKGIEFGHLLEGCDKYPIFIDTVGEVLSMPPIINSNHTGKVTESTRDIFIECSGFAFKYIIPALNVIVTALVDRGGDLETVEVIYADKTIVTPDLRPKTVKIKLEYIESRMGLELGKKKIIKLLEEANYSIKKESKGVL
mgnify:FL=1